MHRWAGLLNVVANALGPDGHAGSPCERVCFTLVCTCLGCCFPCCCCRAVGATLTLGLRPHGRTPCGHEGIMLCKHMGASMSAHAETPYSRDNQCCVDWEVEWRG